ncbi:ATP-binding protein [Brevundimonas guildfordensis]|uniref:histidine kinase n=1 Tax=Brevundimonas guildfordensis TaxID=2762241 RepID=A0ABR8QZN4_9CAUL|nr:ATP-binding protein [Brevundimonas guildfordensis]MBD7940981.1 response regulator [Brevundimonas guildfordensis]
MRTVISCLVNDHDWRLLIVAVLVCLFSLATAFVLTDQARRVTRRSRPPYTAAAALVGGLGVWSTHFIAMQAYDAGAPMRYDPAQTLLSLAVIILSLGASLSLGFAALDPRRRSIVTLGRRAPAGLLPAVTAGFGVAAMHFVGMDAVRLSGAVILWNLPLAIVAVAGGVAIFASAAFMPAWRDWRALAAATVIGALGVCWLHFVGMSAGTVTLSPGVLMPEAAASARLIGLWAMIGVGLTLLIAAFLTGMIWWSRRSVLGQVLEAIHAMPDGLGVYDADDQLQIWNQRFLDISPHLAGALKVGMSFEDVVTIGLKAGVYPDAVGRERDWAAERLAERRNPQGPRELQVGSRWLRLQDRRTSGGGMVTVCSDITDMVRSADVLAEARDAAETANRAKSRFLANMSHEIRTPLNGVIGVAQALARTNLDASQHEMLDLIQASSRTLQTLLSDILDLARIESGRLDLKEEVFDLARVVEEAALLYAAAARDKGLQFIVEVAPEARAWVAGDPVRLKQVLTNLVSNAVKFTTSGFVSLTVDATPAHAPETLRFVVQDTGIGFDGPTRDRLFNRFEQADGDITRHYGGSGLGLAISRDLAAMMDGDLDCESEPGAGAAFILTLPWRKAAAPQAASPAALTLPVERAGPELAPRRLRILAADDHPTNRRVVELILDPSLFDLVSVENGAEAVAAYRAQAFDLVLMDMQMPVMDGLTAVREIRLHEAVLGLPPTPVVMLTANALAEHLDQALVAGADRHMAKPFSVEALLAIVAELTAQTPQAAEAAA